ncbi:MAG: lytic murein transglycosylase [Thermoleophilaceae bacterium]|nr:lytic murein transglycosylase [Thermoleophilaceae bacterium]
MRNTFTKKLSIVTAAIFLLLAAMLVGAISASAAGSSNTGTGAPATETPGLTPGAGDTTDPAAPVEVPAEKPVKPDPAKKPATRKPASQPDTPQDTGGSKPKDSTDKNGDASDPLDGAGGDSSTGPIGVPNIFLEKFQIPPFLLPIYQAAGIQYGIRWEVLAAINEIETNYGRNLNVSSAGALGWMQFMPATWEMYGVDANNDGNKDPFNPVDAIFAAAKYLKAAGGTEDIERAIFAYNHAQWYVDSVILRAKLIAGVPVQLIDSLTGLTQGHFPVYARSTYAGAISKRSASKRAKIGTNAANIVQGSQRDAVMIHSRRGAPVVAVQDATVTKIGANVKLGRYIQIQDGYGNLYTYGNLGTISRLYPVPRTKAARIQEAEQQGGSPEALGSYVEQNASAAAKAPGPKLGNKQRLYANPNRPRPQQAGSYSQLSSAGVAMPGYETFDNYFSQPYGLKREDVVLKRLRKGSRVIGGTILGRIGAAEFGHTPTMSFRLRPAGQGAPLIDPKPILDGWKLLESTAIYRAIGLNPLLPAASNATIGQILLMSKGELETQVLNNKDIDIYECGREDIKAGEVDRRVLALLAFLASEGYKPTVSSLTCGHGLYTTSGNISEHSTGGAVDISAINGQPMVTNNEPGGLMEQTVRKIMQLQGILEPHQIISLFDLGGASFSMSNHNDHVHVGFSSLGQINPHGKLSGKASRLAKRSILKRDDWYKVFDHLGEIDNPSVAVKPSPYALKVHKKHTPRRGAND